MKGLNLIPVHRRVAKQQRMHVRRCIGTCVACGIVSCIACVATFALSPSEDPTVQARLGRVATELATVTRTAEATAGEVNAVEMTLRATRGIADQPDWSVLLALLAKSGGPEIILRGYDIIPAEPIAAAVDPKTKEAAAKTPASAHRGKIAPKIPEPPKVRYALTLQGVGRSQFAVTQFVLRLEQSGLFDGVKLLDTSRQSVNNVDAVGFRIECGFDSGGGQPKGGSTAGGAK